MWGKEAGIGGGSDKDKDKGKKGDEKDILYGCSDQDRDEDEVEQDDWASIWTEAMQADRQETVWPGGA